MDTITISSPPPPMGDSSSAANFPIVAIALLAIMLTAFLLITYYIITLRWYCFNWQPLDSLRRTTFSFSLHSPEPPRHHRHDTWAAYGSASPSPTMFEIHQRGLEEWVVRDIPTIRYKGDGVVGERSFRGCSVCLSEFEERDLLRVLPHCGHLFHLDCVDVWLLNNANCPLCRSNISGRKRYDLGQIIAAPSSSPQLVDDDEFVVVGSSRELLGEGEFVVVEIDQGDDQYQGMRGVVSSSSSSSLRVLSQRMKGVFEQKGGGGGGGGGGTSSGGGGGSRSKRLSRMFRRASIMGDECIDVRRDKEDDLNLNLNRNLNHQHHQQRIRRSFSMDSVVDRQLYLQVQRQVMDARRDGDRNKRMIQNDEISSSSREVTATGSNSSRSFRRLFFPFGIGRSTRFGSNRNNNDSNNTNNKSSVVALPI